jgi:hypothetical protein
LGFPHVRLDIIGVIYNCTKFDNKNSDRMFDKERVKREQKFETL